ncbi:hypothetical protein AAG570_007860 [Ranatra chinensis]|uniref:Cytochrome P450 n=1 Tax=Ranatra chinensis TaxID=642074 RepID=A0ABD0XT19_9HEMI
MALPLLGNAWRFLPIVGSYKVSEVDKVSKLLHETFGDIVRISGIIGRPDMVFLFDADEIEKLFREEGQTPHRPSMPSLNYYKHVLRKDVFGEDAGVIAVHGEGWYKFRTKVQQTMLQPRTAKLYISTIEETVDSFIDRIEKIKDTNSEVPGDFLSEIHNWSLESLARIALDVKLGCLKESSEETEEIIEAINTVFKSTPDLELKIPFWRFFNTPTWNKYVKALDSIQRISMKYAQIAFERLSKDPKAQCRPDSSLLERVLNQNNPHVATVLAFDLFLVGVDTTSAGVANILYQLSLHPEYQEILYEDVTKALGKGPVTSQSLEEMQYVRAFIRETHRLYPSVLGNGRTMIKDTVICGYKIPKGVQIVFPHERMSKLTRYFDSPNEFIPERWFKSKKNNYHPFASLPFGYGKRMCLGRRFADLELLVLTAKIIQKYKIEYRYPKLEHTVSPVYIPNGPLKFRFIKR